MPETNPNRIPENDMLLKLDRRTAEQIQYLSARTKMSVEEVIKWLVFLGDMCFGRKVKFKEQGKEVTISLENFPTITDISNISKPNTPS